MRKKCKYYQQNGDLFKQKKLPTPRGRQPSIIYKNYRILSRERTNTSSLKIARLAK